MCFGFLAWSPPPCSRSTPLNALLRRLCAKFETVRGTGKVVDMEEEFRLLTLQVRRALRGGIERGCV